MEGISGDLSSAAVPRMLPDYTETQLLERVQSGERFAVFVHTPFCGTCKLAERMIAIVATMDNIVPVVRANINFLPWVRRKWELTSVPCLLLFEQSRCIGKRYAFQSVDTVYRMLKIE
ncbi:thioredoxin [Xylanibacillus composti]|uniref:Thiol reductase thioredoxin n=1 Tax=Xylanibacillus composti TaxID=1572762 RepID=A0A8J4H2I7_9BACL|nr:thioredoxin family protein [Xylanibacillus composti]MDT9724222.1 thioredoxin [Xylanibacillus composti]GIQ68261.1 thiol reductase thioredoxin [Xylanibacillus composti]